MDQNKTIESKSINLNEGIHLNTAPEALWTKHLLTNYQVWIWLPLYNDWFDVYASRTELGYKIFKTRAAKYHLVVQENKPNDPPSTYPHSTKSI